MAQAKYSEIVGLLAAARLRSTNQHHNRGMGVTKAQCIAATMDFMEQSGVFNTWYEKLFDAAANVLQNDWSKEVCRLKQTCTPKGAARKYLTTVTDVMILNYAVRFDVARGTQSNTQGVWPCKLPVNSHPLQLLAKSPELTSDLSKQLRRNFPNTVAG